MPTSFEVVRALHLFFAVLWAGGGSYYGWVLRNTKDYSAIEGHIVRFGFHGPYMGLSSLGTVGFGMAAFFMGNYDSDLIGNGAHVLGAGMALGTIAMVLGFAGHLPLERKMMKAAESGEIPADLVRKNTMLNHASGTLIVITLVLMLTFRWFT